MHFPTSRTVDNARSSTPAVSCHRKRGMNGRWRWSTSGHVFGAGTLRLQDGFSPLGLLRAPRPSAITDAPPTPSFHGLHRARCDKTWQGFLYLVATATSRCAV